MGSQLRRLAMRRNQFKLFVVLLITVCVISFHASSWEARYARLSALAFAGVSGIFRDVQQAPVQSNLVAQNEGISRGPWVIDPPLPAQLPTGPYVLRFKCLWHQDLCPPRYQVILRGPIIYSPPVRAVKLDEKDATVVTVEINIPEPGSYQLFAWPDFQSCPKYWRDEMTYPIYRGQVIGTPAQIKVTGRPAMKDSFGRCSLDVSEVNGRSQGRWMSTGALKSNYRSAEWATSYPPAQQYIYQPYGCKRVHRTAAVLGTTKKVSSVLFLGDSVLRGSFCSQVWPQVSPSGKQDGLCTFINDAHKYHVSPKDMLYKTPDGRTIGLSFRFMDNEPVKRLDTMGLSSPPTHIIANLGLWLAPFTMEQYEATVKEFLEKIYRVYPDATVIWRTTTDVASMIGCFSEKGMIRPTIYIQHEISLKVVREMKEKGMKIYVADAYEITAPRPDSGNDGRHWVIESPDEYNWMPKSRPTVNDAEKAVLDAIWDIILQDDEMRAASSQ